MAVVRVYVNDRPIVLPRSMSVRHALIAAGFPPGDIPRRITDEWGQQIGEDGALTDDMRIVIEEE